MSSFSHHQLLIRNLRLEGNVMLGLVCFKLHTLSIQVLCISLLLEKLVEKWPRPDHF